MISRRQRQKKRMKSEELKLRKYKNVVFRSGRRCEICKTRRALVLDAGKLKCEQCFRAEGKQV